MLYFRLEIVSVLFHGNQVVPFNEPNYKHGMHFKSASLISEAEWLHSPQIYNEPQVGRIKSPRVMYTSLYSTVYPKKSSLPPLIEAQQTRSMGPPKKKLSLPENRVGDLSASFRKTSSCCQSMEEDEYLAAGTITNLRVAPKQVSCDHCALSATVDIPAVSATSNIGESGKTAECGGREAFESPLKALAGILKLFQWLGIFNYTVYEEYSEFECQPVRIFWALGLNALFVLFPLSLNLVWLHLIEEQPYGLYEKACQMFSSTDFVALFGFLALLQVDITIS